MRAGVRYRAPALSSHPHGSVRESGNSAVIQARSAAISFSSVLQVSGDSAPVAMPIRVWAPTVYRGSTSWFITNITWAGPLSGL